MTSYLAPGASGPAIAHQEVTPSDTNPVIPRPRSLYAKTAGDIAVQMGGVTIVYPVEAGQVLTLRAEYIMATGTTATVIAWS